MTNLPEDLALADFEAKASRERVSDLRAAAQAVVARWDTPLWKNAPSTGEYINALRAALDQPAAQIDQLVAERDALRDVLEQVTASLDALGDESDGNVSPYVWKKHKCQASIDAARAALNGGRP